MPQIFHRSMNTLSRVSIFGAVFFVALVTWLGGMIVRSPYATRVNVAQVQPVPFSHEHHVGQDGIDCRYCHTSVETSPFAGIPSVSVCMNCHSHLWRGSPMLEPVRAAFRDPERPLVWNRVHDLGDFAYFDHSIHVAKGVACVTCHGRVDRMPLVWKHASLHMEWCLECHRDPAPYIVPRELVFELDEAVIKRKLAELDPDRDWAAVYNVQSKMDCSICHR
ncbi:MAG TPA: cytochrome c3 family protein [Planctomycetaceae bacterium]|nr:cytochrome c3 family protein [Planctomycetaceae bacterium]